MGGVVNILQKMSLLGNKRLDSVHVTPGDAKNKLVEEIVDSKVLTYGVVEIYDANLSMRKRCMELDIPFVSLGFKEKKLLLQFFFLYRYVLIKRPRTLFLHSFYPSVFGVGLVFLCPFTKVISVRHHNRVHLLSSNRKGILLDKIIGRFSYNTVAVSNTVKETMVNQGCKQEKVVVIYNGLRSSKQSYEKVLSTENNSPLRLLAVGRLDWQKNYETMLLVAAELKKRDIDFSLSILGAGGDVYSSKLFEMSRTLNLENEVKWLGWQKSIEDWFSQSDVFLHTALDEACPLVLIEALLYGIPIVTSEAGGSGEIISGFYSGCPGGDVGAFTEEIISTWSHIRESKSKAQSLVPIAKKKFGAETMRKEYELVTLSYLH
jgi:glycosyltransferase involved in cell wall biosynthesis